MMESIQELSVLYLSRYPREAAVSLEKLPAQEAVAFLQGTGKEKAAQVLVYLSPEKARQVFEAFSGDMQSGTLEELSANYGALLLRKLNREQQSEMIKGLSRDKQKQLNTLLSYEKGTVGASMDVNPLVFVEDQSISDCIALVKSTPVARPFFHFYMLDRRGKVTGQCNLHDMIKHREQEAPIGQIKKPVAFLVSGRSEIGNLLQNEELHRRGSLPVIDESGLFIGAIYRESLLEEGGKEGEGASSALGEVLLLGLSGVFQTLNNPNHLE